ncbi:MAG: OmpA family protein [Acidobacteriota bacterium]
MHHIVAVESRFCKRLLGAGVWALLVVSSTGCPHHSQGPDVGGPKGFAPTKGGDLPMVLVDPGVSATATADLRPQVVDPTAEELNRQAHDDGLLVDIYFDLDRSELTEAARADLERNARYLHQSGSLRLLIEGHCDERGTNEYNLALGHLRAQTARDYLIRLGIAAGRLDSISYGEERGVCHASSERCWARNRRAYLRIVSTG